jgi:hypothetical protein
MATLQLVQALQSGLVEPTTGAVLASGRCSFYDVGTLTPQTVYSDSAGATPISQPLILTAGGVGTVYTANPCRCIVKSADGLTTVFDIAVVNGIAAATQFITSTSFNAGNQTTLQTILDNVDDSFGGRDWKYKHSATATEKYIKTWMAETQVSVTDYGAVGDDSTNNLTAIQNAITAASPGVLYIPPGTFRYTGAFSIPAGGIRVVGAGTSASILKQMSTTDHGFVITPPASGTSVNSFSDFTMSLGSTSTGTAIRAVFAATGFDTIKCRNVTTAGGWTNGITNTAGGQTICDGCSISSSGNTITGGTNNELILVSSYAISSAGKGATGSANLFAVNSQITGSTVGADSGTSNLFLSGSLISGGLTLGVAPNAFISGTDTGTVTDGRTGSPVAFVLSGTTSVTPLPAKSAITKIVQGGAGATTTINAPAAALFGLYHTIVCSNTSGGALTWTFNAAFKISAAVAPATGNRISVLFYYDAVDAKWSEVGRSAAVPN